MKDQVTLHLVVVFPSAGKPFEDDAANPAETIGQLKARVLQAFELTEGQTPEGTVTTYTLFHGKQTLENMNQTLAELAGHGHTVQLKLAQQLTQG